MRCSVKLQEETFAFHLFVYIDVLSVSADHLIVFRIHIVQRQFPDRVRYAYSFFRSSPVQEFI